MGNATNEWMTFTAVGLVGISGLPALAGGACSTAAQVGNYQSEDPQAMEWERYFSVLIVNHSDNHWRLRPVGDKRSPMRDLQDSKRAMVGVLELPPGEAINMAFLFNKNETEFRSQFLVEDNHEARDAMLTFCVDVQKDQPLDGPKVTLSRTKDGKAYQDSKMFAYDAGLQVFSIMADTYRPLPKGGLPIAESGESLLHKASPSFPNTSAAK